MLPTLSHSSSRRLLAFACSRNISAKAKCQSLHDKKMEALVSLYHHSNTFITPENLSAVIDQAFIQPLGIAEDLKKHSADEISRMMKLRKQSPKFILGRDDGSQSLQASESMGPGWTESRSRRMDRVYRALMGTQKNGLPSWVALKENGKRIKSEIDKDN